jgi:release factor glutamine methyltransferase
MKFSSALKTLNSHLKKNYDNSYQVSLTALSQVLNIKVAHIIANLDNKMTGHDLIKLNKLIEQLDADYPLSYILGNIEFYREIYQLSDSVLIPRPETEIIVTESLEFLKENESRAIRYVEIGIGSGCITTSILNNSTHNHLTVIATDISSQAIDLSKLNASNNLSQSKYQLINFKVSDFLAEYPPGNFDLIVSNPPYIPLKEYLSLDKSLKFEPRIALTDENDGLTFYHRLADFVKKRLDKKGVALIEIHSDKSSETLKLFKDSLADQVEINIVKDLFQRDRMLKIVRI